MSPGRSDDGTKRLLRNSSHLSVLGGGDAELEVVAGDVLLAEVEPRLPVNKKSQNTLSCEGAI